MSSGRWCKGIGFEAGGVRADFECELSVIDRSGYIRWTRLTSSVVGRDGMNAI